jgi:hypothetical protein
MLRAELPLPLASKPVPPSPPRKELPCDSSLEDLADALDGNLALLVRQSKRQHNRRKSLLPGGVPRWVRCYDNGGKTIDRYTVVFCGRYQSKLWKDGRTTELRPGYQGRLESFPRPAVFNYLAMNAAPFHPQGFGQHGETRDHPCDVNRWGFAPMVGRKCHLGRRIPFADLPEDCRKLVLRDYCELWGLKP